MLPSQFGHFLEQRRRDDLVATRQGSRLGELRQVEICNYVRRQPTCESHVQSCVIVGLEEEP
jgi:hypothetical protein